MIKITNATKEYKDKTLLINPEHIMAVFETIVDDITVTNIYSVTQQSWQVTETIDEVYSIINK